MEQRPFVKQIQSVQRRMNAASVLHKSVAALCIGAGAGILFQAAALVVPFYYASLYSGLALGIALVTAFAIAFVKWISLKQAALAIDHFGFEERIVTAYECLGQEGMLIALQRDDAMNQLARHQDRIQIPLLPSWKKRVLLIFLMAVMSGLALLPSAVKERARELHQVQEEAREKTKEIAAFVDSLEELSNEEETLIHEAFSPEQKVALQEMIESLNDSQAEYAQAESVEMLTAASNKLTYKYGVMGSALSQFAQRLRSGAAVSAMTAESMQAVAEKMQNMGTLAGLSQSGQNGQAFSGSQNGNGSQSGQSGTGSQNGNGGQNGSNGTGSRAGQSGTGSQNGNGGQNGNNGTGSQSGIGSQNGNNGIGNQNGNNGTGSQTGQNGVSQDGQQGDGRGTGSSSATHDYVSIPNDIADSGTLTGNAVNHEDSVYFRAQNGLSWEGTHMSHEAVLGSYEQKAYEGIAAGRYPSGMEEVIKEYFSSFNQ